MINERSSNKITSGYQTHDTLEDGNPIINLQKSESNNEITTAIILNIPDVPATHKYRKFLFQGNKININNNNNDDGVEMINNKNIRNSTRIVENGAEINHNLNKSVSLSTIYQKSKQYRIKYESFFKFLQHDPEIIQQFNDCSDEEQEGSSKYQLSKLSQKNQIIGQQQISEKKNKLIQIRGRRNYQLEIFNPFRENLGRKFRSLPTDLQNHNLLSPQIDKLNQDAIWQQNNQRQKYIKESKQYNQKMEKSQNLFSFIDQTNKDEEEKNRLREQRQVLMKTIDQIILQAKKNSISSLKLESILSDVKMGVVPDFGFLNELKFDDEKVGWQLFFGVIGPYPKYQKLAKYIREYQQQKQQEEYEKLFRKHHRNSILGGHLGMNKFNLIKRSGIQKKLTNQGLVFLNINTNQSSYKLQQLNSDTKLQPNSPGISSLRSPNMKQSRQLSTGVGKGNNSKASNTGQAWKRTISFADEVSYMKMINAQQPSFKKMDDIYQNIKPPATKKPLPQSLVQKELKEKEKQIQIKYKKLKDEADQLNQDFKDHQDVMHRIKINKLDIFYTQNKDKKDRWQGLYKLSNNSTSNASPRKYPLYEEHLKANQNKSIFHFNSEKLKQSMNYNIFNRILNKITEEEMQNSMIQQRIFQAFASYLDQNFKFLGKEAYNLEAERIKKSLQQKGIESEQFNSYLYDFPEPVLQKKKYTPDHQLSVQHSFQGNDETTLKLPKASIKRVSARKSVIKDANNRRSKHLSGDHSPSELQSLSVKKTRSNMDVTKSKSNLDHSTVWNNEQRISTKTNHQYLDNILLSPVHGQRYSSRDPQIFASFNNSPPLSVKHDTDLKYNIKIFKQDSQFLDDPNNQMPEDFTQQSQNTFLLSTQVKSQRSMFNNLQSQRLLSSRSQMRSIATNENRSVSQLGPHSPTQQSYYSSQVNAGYRLSSMIQRLKNIKKKLKIKCELDIDHIKKKDVRKLIVVQQLIKDIRVHKFDFDKKFVKKVQKTNYNDILEEIYLIGIQIKNQPTEQIQKKEIPKSPKPVNNLKLEKILPKRLRNMLRSQTPLFDSNYKVNSTQRRTFLSNLESKLENIKSRAPSQMEINTFQNPLQNQTTMFQPLYPELQSQSFLNPTPIRQRIQKAQTAQVSPRDFLTRTQQDKSPQIPDIQPNKIDLNLYLKHQPKLNSKVNPIKLKQVSKIKMEKITLKEKPQNFSSSTVTRVTHNERPTTTTINQNGDTDSKSLFKTVDENFSDPDYNYMNQSNTSQRKLGFESPQNRTIKSQQKNQTSTNINININQTYFINGESSKFHSSKSREMTPKRRINYEKIQQLIKEVGLDSNTSLISQFDPRKLVSQIQGSRRTQNSSNNIDTYLNQFL